MPTEPNTTGTKAYRVYATYSTRRYQNVEATSPREAYEMAKQPPTFWEDCFEHEDNDEYQISDDVEDVETGEFVPVGEPVRCRTCECDIVEGVNASNFREGECGPCEHRRYRTQKPLLDHWCDAGKVAGSNPHFTAADWREWLARKAEIASQDAHEHAA